MKIKESKIKIIVSLFFAFIAICIIFNQHLDGYFVWISLDQHVITVFWQQSPLYAIQVPFNLSIPLWIPLAPLTVIIIYFIVVWRFFKFKVSFHGKRIHHYHVGLLSIGIAIFLTITLAIMNFLYKEPIRIWLGWKMTTLAEVLQGFSLTLALGGIMIILLDVKDLISMLKHLLNRN